MTLRRVSKDELARDAEGLKQARKKPTKTRSKKAEKLTGSAGGVTTVTYFQGEGESMLRKGTYFAPAEWDAIQAERKRQGVSATTIIRKAVREYLGL